MRNSSGHFPGLIRRIVVITALSALTIVLARAVLMVPPHGEGLSANVAENLTSSGVLHPLTAVLLNFRGYDTLLEIGVLLVAVMAVWSLDIQRTRQLRLKPPAHQNAVLRVGLGIILPVVVVAAGYMVWVGSYRPGGAFQSGALLGAAAVTLISSGMLITPFARSRMVRILLASGFAFFMSVASATVIFKGRLLWYPIEWAGSIILVIETLLALSIGAALAVLFAGVAGLRNTEDRS
ncbi:MAG TPA: MnhB domain-containing protein [Kiritimatiellia bacterium]|nr:MnhB domain-containing protein [Kiritimatiellia bacterium]